MTDSTRSLSLPEGRSLTSINTSEQTHASSLQPVLVNFLQHFSSKPGTNKLWGLYLQSLFPTAKCMCVLSHSVVYHSLWTPRLQLTRFLCPWHFPGKNNGMGLHFLIQRICHPLELTIYWLFWCIFFFDANKKLLSYFYILFYTLHIFFNEKVF